MSDLSKEDLTLLMDSYKKQVELNTQVLTQQQNLIIRLDSMIEIHKETCHNVNKVTDKINDQEKTTGEGFDKISDKLNSDRKESLIEHNDLKYKIYISMSLMGVIILNLVTIMVMFLRNI